MSIRYPPEVHQFIRDNVEGRTSEELASMTNAAFGTNFTKGSMKSYKQNHKLKSCTQCGLPKGHPSKQFPAPVADFIRSHYMGVGPTEMTSRVNQAFNTAYTTRQISAYYKNHKLNSGVTGYFEKGHTPPNKGKKGYCAPGCEKGHFKKGHTPHNKTPIGTVLTKADGYLWKKIGEGARDWKQLHILTWEETNGPVPDGYMLIFKDNNRENCSLDNLALVSKAENAVMNRCGLRFENPEHTNTGILIAKVKIAARKRRKKED